MNGSGKDEEGIKIDPIKNQTTNSPKGRSRAMSVQGPLPGALDIIDPSSPSDWFARNSKPGDSQFKNGLG